MRGEGVLELLAEDRVAEAIAALEDLESEAEHDDRTFDAAALSQQIAPLWLRMGEPGKARDAFLRAWHLVEAAGRPRWEVLGAELDVLRVDVLLGRSQQVQPRLDAILTSLREMHRAIDADDTAEGQDMARALDEALMLEIRAHVALEQWQLAVDRLAEVETLHRQMGDTALALAILRFSRYLPLLRLQRLDEAEALLEESVAFFGAHEERGHEANALSGLATLAEARGDLAAAFRFEQSALALRNALPDLEDRGISHANLANTANRLAVAGGGPDGLSPSLAVLLNRRHRLASLVYGILTSNPHVVAQRIRNLSVDHRLAREAKQGFDLPSVAELVALPDFTAVREAIDASGIRLERVQGRVDAMVTQVRAWSRVKPMF
jgi:tetratricopeptide (TPR) repeat protein